jgi:hypothetical protein
MMVRKSSQQDATIVGLTTTVERLNSTIEGLSARVGQLTLQNTQLVRVVHRNNNNGQQQPNNNNNNQANQPPPPPQAEQDDDDAPLPPEDDDDEDGFDCGVPPPRPPLPPIPRRDVRRNGRRQGNRIRQAAAQAHNNAFALAFQLPAPGDDVGANGGDGGDGNGPPPPVPGPRRNPAPRRNVANPPPPQQQQQAIQQEPVPLVEDMLRNDYVPDIPMGLPVLMTVLVLENERKDLGQFNGQTRHWQKKHKTMWGKWQYLYSRVAATATYNLFAPLVPMERMGERMQLASVMMEAKRKRLRMTMNAFRKSLHGDDTSI